MNPFLNPRIVVPYIKNYLADPGRLERYSPEQLKLYKDKALKKMITYAFTVPVYHDKYKDAGIYLSDIKGIKDIVKLPFISRQDFAKYYPDGLLPRNFKKENGIIICTGGTTTKYCCSSGAQPVCVFTDFSSLLRGTTASFRGNRYFNIGFKKTRFSHIGNYNPYKYDAVFEEHVLTHLKKFFSLKNHLNLQASNKTYEIIEKLDRFQPDVITSYPSIFQDIAYLKRKGLGKNINPKLLIVGGAMLDAYTHRYVEDAFNCNMYNTYASCEAGAIIAYECIHRNWHINEDFFHLEATDENMNLVDSGERGLLAITKLWGRGTPIIRYTGMKDWITLSNGKKCSCGNKSTIFGRPVEGRIMSNVILPDGRVFPPNAFLFITDVLKDLKTYKIKKYQIIQNKLDGIEILLEIDEDLRAKGPSVSKIIKKITRAYEDVVGPKVNVDVREVEKIEDNMDSGKPAPLVISNVDISCDLT